MIAQIHFYRNVHFCEKHRIRRGIRRAGYFCIARPLGELTQCPIFFFFPFLSFLFILTGRVRRRLSNVSKLLPRISRDCTIHAGFVNRARDDSDGFEASTRALRDREKREREREGGKRYSTEKAVSLIKNG